MLRFWLEKNYFSKKYKSFLQKNTRFQGYMIDGLISNQDKHQQAILFINHFSDYLQSEDTNNPTKFISKGHLQYRETLMKVKEIPYIELSYSDVRLMINNYHKIILSFAMKNQETQKEI